LPARENHKCGRLCIGQRKVNLSTVFAGQKVGIGEVADRIWLAGGPDRSFMEYDPGFFDEDEGRVEPVGKNPFAQERLPPKVLPMLPE